MIEQYNKARKNLLDHISNSGIAHHMFYGPTSHQFWDESFKLVAVNMEPYGYEQLGIYQVDRDELINWIYDAGNTRTKTTRYTMTILGAVLTCLQDGIAPSRELLRSIYKNCDKIEDTLDRTAYYNIRAQSNSSKPQDYAAISEVGKTETGRLIWSEILSLNPDVIVVGGRAGLEAINRLLEHGKSLNFRNSLDYGALLIQSITHPSRPAYNHWVDAIQNILEWKKTKAEQAGPGYPPQSVGSPDP